jgi:NADH:ubiquinone oxidoreductase subunit E
MMIDEEVFGMLNEERTREIIEGLIEENKGGMVHAIQD